MLAGLAAARITVDCNRSSIMSVQLPDLCAKSGLIGYEIGGHVPSPDEVQPSIGGFGTVVLEPIASCTLVVAPTRRILHLSTVIE